MLSTYNTVGAESMAACMQSNPLLHCTATRQSNPLLLFATGMLY